MKTLSLFEAFGIEVEYMLVTRGTLDVASIAHAVLTEMNADEDGMVECGPVAWSNELAAHVIELKTNGPMPNLEQAFRDFGLAIREMNQRLAAHGACLLPGGMHPWMDPEREFELYPVDDAGYYGCFDRIFDCRGHGWSNLQSMHINLPFADDAELARLHSAIRLLLPILPALSASSPIVEGKPTGELDHRLFVYGRNAAKVPSVSGLVVPEHIESRADYEQRILERVYTDLAPHDPEGILRYEWVNARGCIARFDRMALEIRVLDSQECPRADGAVAFAACEVLRAKCSAAIVRSSAAWSTERLAEVLWRVARDGQAALLEPDYAEVWGVRSPGPLSAGELWRRLLDEVPEESKRKAAFGDACWLLEHGTLATRILDAVGTDPDRAALQRVYRELCACLAEDRRFGA